MYDIMHPHAYAVSIRGEWEMMEMARGSPVIVFLLGSEWDIVNA